MTVSLIGVCAAIIITVGIVIVSHRISRRIPDIDVYSGWLIEHTDRRNITIRCPDCDFETGATDLNRRRMPTDRFVEIAVNAIEQSGIHQHQHQEDL